MAELKVQRYGKIYTGGDIKASFLGTTPDGVDAIMYGVTQAKENVYSMGSRKPVGRIHKEEVFDSSITVKPFVLDALERSAPGGKITRITAFTIGVSYMDDEQNTIKRDELLYVEFTGVKRESKNDNNELVYELPLVIGDIEVNV
jgi:hypothetical protein